MEPHRPSGGATKALVTSDRRLFHFSSKAQFNDWAKLNASLPQKYHGNVRQLLGFDPLPPGREQKRSAHDNFLLEDTTWMYHEDCAVAVPLFGSQHEKYMQLQQHGTLKMSLATFKIRLQQAGTMSKCGWWCGPEPASVATLEDGNSLFNIPSLLGRTSAEASVATQLPAVRSPACMPHAALRCS